MAVYATTIPLAVLGLLTLADTLTSTALFKIIDPSISIKPGFWNLGTTYVIISGVSDLLGQLVLGYLADTRADVAATLVNTTSISLASVVSLVGLLSFEKWPILAAVVAPLFRVLGGGSHATSFLTLVHLHQPAGGMSRSALYYFTGAVIVVAQICATNVTPLLTRKSSALPYTVSIVCCLLAYCMTALGSQVTPPSSQHPEDAAESASEPLLPREVPADNQGPASKISALWNRLDEYTSPLLSNTSRLRPIALAFTLAAISKATRPLFTSYIQERDGVTGTQAQQLWLLRSILSVLIFAFLLPLAVWMIPSRTSISEIHTTLYASRASIILMGIGALLIGLAQSPTGIVVALIINTLGVATDLSLLAFAAYFIASKAAGRSIMLIASLESAGSLLGIGILYPVYQWSITQSALAGGTPYYICAGIYAIVAVVIWSLKPVSSV